MEEEMNKIRKPAVAGFFYPSSPDSLSNQIEEFLVRVDNKLNPSQITGIVSPHAGYTYSGLTAAHGFSLLKGKNIETVIIISPSHREYFPGISIYNGDAYQTPLGLVEINKTMAEKIIEGSRSIFFGEQGHHQEHAIEVQLPFIQEVLPYFKLVPVVMGDQGKDFVDDLAERLSKVIDERTVIVASSDLSHYFSSDVADKMDSLVAKRISQFDYEGLWDDLEQHNCEACGGGPIVALMKAASIAGRKNSAVLNRSDSGDASGDKSEVVGYISAIVY
jgi:hypothetical protein